MRALVRSILVAAALAAAWAGAPHAASRAPGRVVAVADIHGDLDAFTGILQRAGLVDAARKWTGGLATLVQLGDMIDRGPKSRAVLDFVMSLQKDARRADGRVLVVLGNHEVLNMFGDLRYLTPGDYASYADSESEHRRARAWDDYAKLNDGKPPQSRDEWMAAHPAGFVEQRQAFGPDGTYGRWLRGLPAIVKVDDSLFVHGGLSDDMTSWTLSRINDRVTAELKTFDDVRAFLVARKLVAPYPTMDEVVAGVAQAAQRNASEVEPFLSFHNWLTISENGPLWFRGFAKLPDADAEALAAKVTHAFGVTRLVMGHTPGAGTIVQRFGDEVYFIDTGMLRGYVEGGRASALEIADGHVRAIYPDGTTTLK